MKINDVYILTRDILNRSNFKADLFRKFKREVG